MDRVTLSMVLFGLLIAIFVISKYYINKQQMKRIGKVAAVINYNTNKKKAAGRIIFIMLLAMISFAGLSLLFYDEIHPVLVILQGSALGILAYYQMGQYSRLYFGEYGFFGAGCKFKSIDEVAKAKWDKDIGQQRHGLKIYINSSTKPFKLYIPKEYKNDIENYFAEKIESKHIEYAE